MGVRFLLGDLLHKFNRITVGDVVVTGTLFWAIWPLIAIADSHVWERTVYKK